MQIFTSNLSAANQAEGEFPSRPVAKATGGEERRRVFENRGLAARIRRTLRYNTTCRDAWMYAQSRQIPAGSKVLDVGSGCAPYRHLFENCQYYTQDFGREPGTQGKYAPLDFECDITSIPVANGTFDVVVCTEVLEHLPEPILAIKEIARVLRPGGVVLLTAPLGSLLHQEPFHFYGGYTPHWYREFLPRHQLEIRSLERNRGFFSLFAQEAQRFTSYLSPRQLLRRPVWMAAMLPLWLTTLPLFKFLLPALARSLDELDLEQLSTAGYHVVATKRAA